MHNIFFTFETHMWTERLKKWKKNILTNKYIYMYIFDNDIIFNVSYVIIIFVFFLSYNKTLQTTYIKYKMYYIWYFYVHCTYCNCNIIKVSEFWNNWSILPSFHMALLLYICTYILCIKSMYIIFCLLEFVYRWVWVMGSIL